MHVIQPLIAVKATSCRILTTKSLLDILVTKGHCSN